MNDLMTKSFLNYVDLKKEVLKDLESNEKEFEMAYDVAPADYNLRRFYDEASLVREEMATIRESLVRLQEANEEGKSLHKLESL